MNMTTEEFKQINKLHVLAQVAVEDMESCFDTGRYAVNSIAWHDGISKKCKICLAGAVMAQTLQAPHRESFAPIDYENELRIRLRAINYIRSGSYIHAYELLRFGRVVWGGKTKSSIRRLLAKVYVSDHRDFQSKEQCQKFIDDMKNKIIPDLQVLDV